MRRVLPHVAAVLGLAILLVYLNFAFGWLMLSQRLSVVLAFAIGPAAIFGILALSERLTRVFVGSAVRLGTVFMVIAFALLTLMLTMQQAVFAEYHRLLDTAASEQVRTVLNETFSLVTHVQLGADVAFDVFYSLGIILISSALVRKGGLGRIVGTYGLLVAGGLLALNIWFFPTPPAAAGSVDLGPATIGWWLGLIVLDDRLKRREVFDVA
jgi:hypothetical protein